MKTLRIIRNYICYCGIGKDEFNAVKKDAYISNFGVWHVLHCLMVAVFGLMFVNSLLLPDVLLSNLLRTNRILYLIALVYSAAATCAFFILKKDSLIAQLLIYLSISLLFVFGGMISQNSPQAPAVTFIVLLLITPMFMIDKPFFMAFELCAAAVIFLVWMHAVKPPEVWQYDLVDVTTYTIIGIFLHVIANSIRIREFVLTRKINIQKDLDELTGLKNKDALTREINAYLADPSADRGLMFILDVDRFKSINDTFGHDVGDSVIHQLGLMLGGLFSSDDIVGRFGGDEFIVFLKGTDDPEAARKAAQDMIAGAAEHVAMPEGAQKVSVSIGIAVYHGAEKNYSEIFKKADTALYRSKADPENRFSICGQPALP